MNRHIQLKRLIKLNESGTLTEGDMWDRISSLADEAVSDPIPKAETPRPSNIPPVGDKLVLDPNCSCNQVYSSYCMRHGHRY